MRPSERTAKLFAFLAFAPLLPFSLGAEGKGASGEGRSRFLLSLPSVPAPRSAPQPRQERAEASPSRRPEGARPSEGRGRTPPFEVRRQQDAAAAVESAGAGGRLDYCTEYTKPRSLRIFLFGTPHNHRAPPA